MSPKPRTVSRAVLHTEQGDLLKKVCQRACAVELVVDVLSAGVPLTSHASASSSADSDGVTDAFSLILMRGWGPGAAVPRNGRTTKLPSPVPGITAKEEFAAEGDVFPLRACCCWLRFFRDGAQSMRTDSSCFWWG